MSTVKVYVGGQEVGTVTKIEVEHPYRIGEVKEVEDVVSFELHCAQMTVNKKALIKALGYDPFNLKLKGGDRAKCGHCGFEGFMYGQPHNTGVSAPWCPKCEKNDKLTKIRSSELVSPSVSCTCDVTSVHVCPVHGEKIS